MALNRATRLTAALSESSGNVSVNASTIRRLGGGLEGLALASKSESCARVIVMPGAAIWQPTRYTRYTITTPLQN